MPRQDLERHLPVQLGIGGMIDLPHAPLANEGGHVVMGESGTDTERHESLVNERRPVS